MSGAQNRAQHIVRAGASVANGCYLASFKKGMASGTFYPLCPSWCSVLWSLGDAVACDVSEVGCSKPPLGPVLWALRSWRAAEGDLGRAEKETGRGLVARHGPLECPGLL